eukprot:TRINITY_DN11784_c0_g3_i2.p1 TRINITY_DN11784_c0_g3~~TRINITY_DN11784_c0_g3_i2.p1  ORF type:complete len:545 (+),score=110.03 TRINITY_DN11784_c0_g3_i2:477-2111(+)
MSIGLSVGLSPGANGCGVNLGAGNAGPDTSAKLGVPGYLEGNTNVGWAAELDGGEGSLPSSARTPWSEDPGTPADICRRLCGSSGGDFQPPEDAEEQWRSLLSAFEGTSGSRSASSSASPVANCLAPPTMTSERRIILVLTHDNIAALLVLAGLSVLGAIYLWKICTRHQCSCRICKNQYRTLNLLGSGGYGSVYLVERIDTGETFVSKKIPIRDFTEVDEYSREAKDLVQLRHRHIVSYEEDFVHVEHGTFEPKTYFIIIMEYCPEGDLKAKIETDFDRFTEEWVRTIFAQILQAVQYLHSKNVIHRDLKSQNVFLAANGLVRLGDFGLCRRTRGQLAGTGGAPVASLTHAGTDCYMAPEMLSSSRYGKPADMWSLGCVLYELLTGQFMWELDGILGAMLMKDSHAVQKLVQANIMPTVGRELHSLLKRLLSASPTARPTATACMRKKLFKRSFPLSKVPFGASFAEGSEGRSASASDRSSEGCLEGLTPLPLGASFGEQTPPSEDDSSCDDDDVLSEGERITTPLELPSVKRRKRRRRTGRR